MTDSQVRVAQDAELVFTVMLQKYADSPVGNRALQEAVGWAQRGRFQRARDTLIAAGVMKVLPGGRGGRLALIDGLQATLPDLGQLAASSERELYPRLVPHLSRILQEGDEGDEDDVPEENVAIAVTGDAGGSRSRRFGRPDLTGAVRRRFRGFDALEVHAFEVKGYWYANRIGIYESAAQRAIGVCTHSWLVVYLPDESLLGHHDQAACQELRGRLRDLRLEAADLGIGFIEAAGLSEGEVHMRQLPKREAVSPKRLDDYLHQACPDLLNQIGIEPKTVAPF